MFYLLYSFVFFCSGFLIICDTRLQKIAYFWYYFGIVLFWGLAYHYAVDTPVYMDYYKYDVEPLSKGLALIGNLMEPGFNLIAQLCKTISPHYVLFQIVLFGTEMVFVLEGFRKLFDDKTVVFFTPLLFFLYPFMMSALRQGVAIAIFIYALHVIDEEKPWRFFIWIFVASLFHQSALMLIPIYFAKYIKGGWFSKDWLLLSILVICDIAWVLGFSVSNDISFLTDFLLNGFLEQGARYANGYIYDEAVASEVGIAKIVEINFTSLLFVRYFQVKNHNRLFRLILIIYMIVQMVFGGLFAHRILYYFNILYYVCFTIVTMELFCALRLPKELSYVAVSIYFVWWNVFHGGLIDLTYTLLISA